MDTDSIVKMGRYGLLNEFETLAIAQGHARPFRRLFEIKKKIDSARLDPTRSIFGTKIALEMCWSFAMDCVEIPRAQSNQVLEELLEIDGIDAGEALLLEYAIRTPNSLLISGDKRMVRAICSPEGKAFHSRLIGRVLHLNRIVQLIGSQAGRWDPVRACLVAAPTCDTAIYDAVAPHHHDVAAKSRLLTMATAEEASSRGLLRSRL